MPDAGARWPGYAAAAWGVLFAVPSLFWALGNDFGASTTVSPSLVELAQDGVAWFLAVLWATVVLKLVAAAIGLGLTRSWGPAAGRLLVCCGWGAGVLLAWHGLLFIVQGLLVEAGAVAIDPALRGISRWYLYLWGPWFLLGGLAFAAAARRYVRRSPDGRATRIAGLVGAGGALALSAAALVSGLG
ncbi:DUF3995 domain-containing protein [Dactylosporangium sp. CA-139066]|uniref:DUF3995 domain-containing protein n=1 Tax=Dactylosporangium sp. CA-139066 TaxID=3239930 RepID=UPI003D8C8374